MVIITDHSLTLLTHLISLSLVSLSTLLASSLVSLHYHELIISK
ncbi:unnamed protein product [Spirodela intermedia]|uniref:Uncharacterized protein n=2 Tax=Spirodela intermedia TaxID=51605 RepID=A0A7I8J341_SPIIN|nr:unnamed protein product [Spirodela intermedia]CAA6664667.1 unnamed protein product [Spirodela intermedia]CAA7401269.1 unnamed protein product [Spirodela intermedia]